MRKCLLLLCFLMVTAHAKITICFTPDQNCESLFVSTIDQAQHTLDIQEYHLNSHSIVAAVLRAKERGVIVRVILDKVAKREADPFLNDNIPVWIDDKVRIAHNKVMIIDGRIVIGGSYNPTQSAQRRNAENLTITDDKDVAKLYEMNFKNRLNNSIILTP